MQNIYVLYLTFIAAIAQILYLLGSAEEILVLIFILTAIAVSLYNKNMIIILITAIIFVNLVKYGVYGVQRSLRENYDSGISQDDTNTKLANLVNDKNTVTRNLKEKIPEEEAKLNKLKSHVATLNGLINQTDQLNDTLKENQELYKTK
jgi:TolA-binding protein